MPRWKLILEYDGTDFQGWQRQPEGTTVEGVVEAALSQFCGREIDIAGQGRTDSGVHAEGQVAHTDLPDGIELPRLLGAMRGLLPPGVALIDAEITDDSFHARFNAKNRRYRYQISTVIHPLKERTCWFVPSQLTIGLLEQSAEMVQGEHDFCNFSKLDDIDMSTICLITTSAWQRSGDMLIYHVEGNRFLRHMVRRLVGTMVHVASGRIPIRVFESLLTEQESAQKGFSAPAKGLILERVQY